MKKLHTTTANGERLTAHSEEHLKRLVNQSDARKRQRDELVRRNGGRFIGRAV